MSAGTVTSEYYNYAIWAGGSGSLGGHWIIGEVDRFGVDGSPIFVRWIYGSPTSTEVGQFVASFTGTAYASIDTSAGGNLSGSISVYLANFDNPAVYTLAGSLTTEYLEESAGCSLDIAGGTLVAEPSGDAPHYGLYIAGALTVSRGGTVSTTLVTAETGSSVIVSGQGSSLTSIGAANGLDISGAFTITGGATVSATSGVGGEALAAGTGSIVTVSGQGSSLTLICGAAGGSYTGLYGSLTVSAGGVLSTSGANYEQFDAAGFVVISGRGSELVLDSGLGVSEVSGNLSGNVQVEDQASVSANGDIDLLDCNLTITSGAQISSADIKALVGSKVAVNGRGSGLNTGVLTVESYGDSPADSLSITDHAIVAASGGLELSFVYLTISSGAQL